MKNLTLIAIASLVVGGSYVAFAQAGHEQHQQGQATQPAKSQAAPTMEMCQKMKADQEGMMAKMKAMDTQVGALVKHMDQAKGDEKLSVIAEIVRMLASQRKEMHANMEGKHGQMMGHMMQHMASGKMECPMMKGMMGGGMMNHGGNPAP